MPIKGIFWDSNRYFDIHILRGQSISDLTADHLRFRKVDNTVQSARAYLFDPANAGDVKLEVFFRTGTFFRNTVLQKVRRFG